MVTANGIEFPRMNSAILARFHGDSSEEVKCAGDRGKRFCARALELEEAQNGGGEENKEAEEAKECKIT
jgi:hypothetical protein